MTFLENVDKVKLQKILLIAISVLVLIALTLLLVIIILSIDPSGLKETNMDFTDLTLTEDDVSYGDLILADGDHPFEAGSALKATMVNLQEYRNNNRGDTEKGPYYTMNNVQLSSGAVGAAHNLLVAAEKAVKEDDLLIKYAFNSTDGSTAEYNTGMLMYLTNYDEEKLPKSYGDWIDANSAKYGFIESFENAYRYVGVAHAQYMTSKELSLQEYISYLKENTDPRRGLATKTDDGTQYYIYYVAAKAGDTIKVPSDVEYVISGTNEGGVIVTVILNK